MNREENPKNNLSAEQKYEFKDMVFIVTPEFKNEGTQSLFTVLLNLMKSDVENTNFI